MTPAWYSRLTMTALPKPLRDHSIDTLRGFACLLVVIYHVIGYDPATGLRVPEGDFWRVFNDTLVYFHMPIFSFLAGVVYAWRPFQNGFAAFIRSKACRLLVPMLVAGTLFALMQALTPGTNAKPREWYLLHIIPVAHFWFLEALFWVFLLVAALEKTGLLARTLPFAGVMMVAAGLFMAPWMPNVFSLDGAAYLLPFFLAGLACHRFSIPLARYHAALFVLLALSLAYLFLFGDVQAMARHSVAALAIGVFASAWLFALRPSFMPLAFLGVYSFVIYLFHPFFTSLSRMVLTKMGINDFGFLFAAGLVAGVSAPIVIGLICQRNDWLRFLVLGEPRQKKAMIRP
jgi:peptidoglycan/LPS O-acetylase OafA/YrhL